MFFNARSISSARAIWQRSFGPCRLIGQSKRPISCAWWGIRIPKLLS